MFGPVRRATLLPILLALFGLGGQTAGPAFATDVPAADVAAAQNPTVRLYATREGLVGKSTASGHVIGADDHFVALPAKSALGKTVILAYQGKTTQAPVLDVGPWNRDDAWWETGAARGQFKDLPQWVPEAWAAWNNGYNNGRDGTGRFISFPAMIDLADGVYNDLGMTHADWVDVTLPWVNAASPPPLAPPNLVITKKIDPSIPPIAHDDRYFSQTGYRIDDDSVWDYFRARGRVDVFGLPVSRSFLLLGCKVQIFQRQVAQVCGGQAATLLNLLDPDIFPYDHVNGSVLPAPDADLKARTPSVSTPNYGSAMIDFIHANAPDVFESQPVAFSKTFFGLITPAMAGTDNPLVNLEVWGAPISHPQRDPTNASFVYQRFQRGIMHFDQVAGATQALLLADYLKAILRDRDLPADLRQQAKGSRFFSQYCPTAAAYVCRPADLPATDLTYAFEQG
jgi:hypothetical protein